jgi:hypothetical protein
MDNFRRGSRGYPWFSRDITILERRHLACVSSGIMLEYVLTSKDVQAIHPLELAGKMPTLQ